MATNGNPLAFPTGQDYQSSRSDEFQQLEARPYRSKKRRPYDSWQAFDYCFVRRLTGVLQPGATTAEDVASTKCTFLSVPPVKKRRSLGENGDQAKQDPGIGSKLAGLQRVHKLAKQHTEAASISDSSERLRTTVIPGRTFLYTGASSDQDVYLLRHLPFRGKSAFGTANWTVWKALAREFGPAYFTSYPDHLLDAREGAYELDHVKNLVEPNHSVLLSIYYSHFHPSLPILEDLIAFEELLSANKIPASLLAAVYCAALDFQPGVDVALKQELRELVFLGVTYEARTPSLRTVQANLIYLQIAPMLVREPNHPGYWPLTSQLVAVSQEIGLHANPEAWDLSSAERKSRRILWWTVYMQDKWFVIANTQDNQFDLTHLADTDFTNDVGGLNEGHLSSVVAFISLTKLSVVLASVLDNFYTVKDSADRLSAEQALQRASKCQAQLTTWYTENAQIWEQPGSVINSVPAIPQHRTLANAS
ncbi:uncharacterized protein HMPREF1541_10989 [Cyphellophora europaea CBS 101466]|uniref:Xylanolytic transcriptional activator regulatory domain-containing protein n=1 Tax=Cyphellophora europaea (strain CBS 101466) TaxID=1220924 RepID=W2S748_CYPE1|nr:uncharacterized protein HMPREF1541_10989 [Cyphellophora europaea CBS 101466]ETN43858.1 hypothetical protein HMPREF1541_10989 [Cyphellophora europaea CBS 101466]